VLISAQRMPWNKGPVIDLGERLRPWVDHPSACIQLLALWALPEEVPAWAKTALMQKLKAKNPALRSAALWHMRRTKDPSIIPDLLDLIRKDPSTDVAKDASQCAFDLSAGRDDVCLAWADRLELAPIKETSEYIRALAELETILIVKEESSISFYRFDSQVPGPQKRAGARAWWTGFIRSHVEEIRAGKKFTRDQIGFPRALDARE
jgi:hypothetical protein